MDCFDEWHDEMIFLQLILYCLFFIAVVRFAVRSGAGTVRKVDSRTMFLIKNLNAEDEYLIGKE
ncbi:MAG: hypothetical protein IJ192_04465 [Clostridia bacterium]|nr:hypothetical protein [Clostridia bacterium]